MVIDADADVRRDVLRSMSTLAMRVHQAESTERALEVALAHESTLDCIILDIGTPGAWTLITRLREEPETANIPLVVLLAKAPTEQEMLALIEAGVVDHVQKPLTGILLCAKIRSICERSRTQRELRNKLKFALENAAHDVLTGLFNRRYFERRLREESAHARRHKRPFSIILIDLDHFKLVNDTYGHEDGDRVLRHVSEVVQASLREDDVACRWGGEEFMVLLRGTGGAAARVVANRLRASLQQKPIPLGDKQEPRHVTFSGGVAWADERNQFEAENIVARADAALYRAKRGGRNRVEAE